MYLRFIDELKILDDKIKANQAQYNLDREAAKISTPLGKVLNKGLEKDNKKEGLLKRFILKVNEILNVRMKSSWMKLNIKESDN